MVEEDDVSSEEAPGSMWAGGEASSLARRPSQREPSAVMRQRRWRWKRKDKKIQTPLNYRVTEPSLVKKCSIAHTGPGHEMMTVAGVKDQLKNVGFPTYICPSRRKVGAGVEGWPQESGPSEVAPSRGTFRAGRAAWQERANREITVMETKKVPAKEWKADGGAAE